MSDDDNGLTRAARELQEAYLDCVSARRNWHAARSTGMSPEEKEALHADLEAKVFGWYEMLVPYLRQYDAVKEYWEQARLWPRSRAKTIVLVCPECEHLVEDFDDSGDDVVQPNDVCLECGEGQLERKKVNAIGEDGSPVYHWDRGLRTVDRWRGKTETKREVRGTFRKRVVSREAPVRLNPDKLVRVARLLDEAADKLGLIARVETEESQPAAREFDQSVPTDGDQPDVDQVEYSSTPDL